MGRYNIPKADSKELINEVQNSSSGDGGIKEYYYKIINSPSTEELNIIGQMVSQMMTMYSIIYKNNNSDVTLISTVYLNRDGVPVPLYYIMDKVIAFSCLKNATYSTQYSTNDILKFEGDLYERLGHFSETEIYDLILQILTTYVQEITKEEYESIITYKP